MVGIFYVTRLMAMIYSSPPWSVIKNAVRLLDIFNTSLRDCPLIFEWAFLYMYCTRMSTIELASEGTSSPCKSMCTNITFLVKYANFWVNIFYCLIKKSWEIVWSSRMFFYISADSTCRRFRGIRHNFRECKQKLKSLNYLANSIIFCIFAAEIK